MSEHQLPRHLSKPPTGPLEILLPDPWPLSEPPRFIGKLISYLVISQSDTSTIAIDVQNSRASTSDSKLQDYLDALSRDGELGKLVEHSRAAMHPSEEAGAIGWLGAVQQEWSYVFSVFEHSEQTTSKWEIHRKVMSAQAKEPSIETPTHQHPKPWWKFW